ncbi:substrate-binding periplasmic protein [Kordiimonas lacus]|uniref:Extracellular solute-binding protein, family 3 n=1 Tax=Kordiimonas lacus TaxID=637679 RepID=A0A1G6ZRM4_9PROT|nr:transporter substrate-binding domain-containing protein [Kordiimonas lacus]SDE05162.1 extracellular solute-binding protein, family 3 [Kordiimonas lacus]
MNFRRMLHSAVWCALVLWGDLYGAAPVQAEGEPIRASRLEASVFRDVWHAILEESAIPVELVEIPGHEDRRRRFVTGELVLDCCSIKQWRDSEEEIAVQLWSRPVFYTVDHLVLHDGRKYDLPDPTDLRAFKVAVVHGFSYQGDDLFGRTVVLATIEQVMDAVASGEADLTIVNSQEFRRLQKLKRRPLQLGPEHNELVLRARVHQSRPDLLAQINEAIKRLQSSGRIATLTGARLRSGN